MYDINIEYIMFWVLIELKLNSFYIKFILLNRGLQRYLIQPVGVRRLLASRKEW